MNGDNAPFSWRTIVPVISIAVFPFLAILLIDAGSVAGGTTHYVGGVVVTPEEQIRLSTIIEQKADYGPLNSWKPGYHTTITDDGTTILHYGFFSKDDSLPFNKSK